MGRGGRKVELGVDSNNYAARFHIRVDVERARREVRDNKDVPSLPEVRFESFDEGTSAQTLHIGPFSEEGPTVERVHEFIESRGYALRARHHEIYRSDLRRTDPERLRPIIRQPLET